jgi:hypothetical protein
MNGKANGEKARITRGQLISPSFAEVISAVNSWNSDWQIAFKEVARSEFRRVMSLLPGTLETEISESVV